MNIRRTVDESRRRQRPYFIWDYDITEDEVHAILKSEDEDQKAWLIGRILEAARWEDIWKYVTVDEVRRYFDRVRMRPFQREIWEYVLEVWSRRDGILPAGDAAPGGARRAPACHAQATGPGFAGENDKRIGPRAGATH